VAHAGFVLRLMGSFLDSSLLGVPSRFSEVESRASASDCLTKCPGRLCSILL
jgi:hypothetical protein